MRKNGIQFLTKTTFNLYLFIKISYAKKNKKISVQYIMLNIKKSKDKFIRRKYTTIKYTINRDDHCWNQNLIQLMMICFTNFYFDKQFTTIYTTCFSKITNNKSIKRKYI